MADFVQGDHTVRSQVHRYGLAQEGSHPPTEVAFKPISALVPRQRSKLKGRIETVALHLWPATSYRVELRDGTGTVFLRFAGRSSLPGFEPGRWLGVEGTPAEISGQLVILNPLYCFCAPPVGPDPLISRRAWRIGE
jgi:hypothetical protein